MKKASTSLRFAESAIRRANYDGTPDVRREAKTARRNLENAHAYYGAAVVLDGEHFWPDIEKRYFAGGRDEKNLARLQSEG